jgi:osmotically inducible protein OsmC
MATFSRRAVAAWTGEVARGIGEVAGATAAFHAAVTFPRLGGEPAGTTTPEEMLAASQATCYAIGLRSVIGRRGGKAERVTVTATITAEKSGGLIRIVSSHLQGVVDGLEGIESAELAEIAKAAEEGCTISNAIRGAVAISVDVGASAGSPSEPARP